MSARTSEISTLREILEHPYFTEGLCAYREGRFFEAHEIWEDLWRQTIGEHRKGIQALIQLAAGFLKLRQGNRIGARALWRRASANGEGLAKTLPSLAPVFAQARLLASMAEADSLYDSYPPIPIPDPEALLSLSYGDGEKTT